MSPRRRRLLAGGAVLVVALLVAVGVVAFPLIDPRPATTVAATIPSGPGIGPDGMVFAPDGDAVYIVDTGSGRSSDNGPSALSVLDTGDRTLGPGVPVSPGGPGSYRDGLYGNPAVSPDGSRAYVVHLDGHDNNGTVVIVDTTRNAVIGTVPVDHPLNQVLTPDGHFLYVATLGSLTVIDTVTARAVATVAFPGDAGAFGDLVASPDGRRIYGSSEYTNTLSIVDTGSNTLVASVPVPEEPAGVAVSSDGSRVYVASSRAKRLSVMDTSTDAVIASLPLAESGYSVHDVVLSPDDRYAYVARTEGVDVVDTGTNTVTATVDVQSPSGLAVSPDGSEVYASQTYDNSVTVLER